MRGPLLAPKRTIDVSGFVGWLTLRSVEQQSRKLEAIELGKRETAIDDGWGAEAAAAPAPPLPKNFQLPGFLSSLFWQAFPVRISIRNMSKDFEMMLLVRSGRGNSG